MFSGHHPRRVGQAISHLGENNPVVASEAFAAPDGLHKEYWQKITFGEGAPARAETHVTSAIMAAIRLCERRFEGSIHTWHLG
jgi:hypothetical protein